MSHEFSIVQAFAGYYSLQYKLLSTCILDKALKRLLADLWVEFCRQLETILQTDMSNLQIQICQRLIFFQQMRFYWNIWAYLALIWKLCHLPIGRFEGFNHQYIQWLKKLSPRFLIYGNDSYIFDTHIIVLLCKYLSQLGFLSRQQRICELQLQLNQ
jgi:hypothetical protein